MTEPKEPTRTDEPQVDATIRLSSPVPGPASAAPDNVTASLTVLRGRDPGRVYPFRGVVMIIGRADTADIHVDDTGISREHAAVSYHADGREFRVKDLGSVNGTLLNGSRVTSYALRNGDKLLVGETLLQFDVRVEPTGP